MEYFPTLWKVFRHFGKFPHSLEYFWTLWKVSGHSQKFFDPLENYLVTLESSRTLWDILLSSQSPRKISGNIRTLSRHSKNFLVLLKDSGQSGKVSRHCGKFSDTLEKFLDTLESFHTLLKDSGHCKVSRYSGKF